MSRRISNNVYNALTELGNIGAGNAATSLSVMLNTELKMSAPKVSLYDFDSLENMLGGPDTTVVGVVSMIEGYINAMILFVLKLEDAENMVKTLINPEASLESEMGHSAIKEIANIIMGSYVSSLETLTGMKIRHSLPDICIDMAASILSVPCIEFGKVGDKALIINSEFESGNQKINGIIMMVSEEHSYDMLLKKLGIEVIDG